MKRGSTASRTTRFVCFFSLKRPDRPLGPIQSSNKRVGILSTVYGGLGVKLILHVKQCRDAERVGLYLHFTTCFMT